MKEDPIIIECPHCAGPIRWIPKEIQEELDKLHKEVTRLEKALRDERANSVSWEPIGFGRGGDW